MCLIVQSCTSRMVSCGIGGMTLMMYQDLRRSPLRIKVVHPPTAGTLASFCDSSDRMSQTKLKPFCMTVIIHTSSCNLCITLLRTDCSRDSTIMYCVLIQESSCCLLCSCMFKSFGLLPYSVTMMSLADHTFSRCE